MRVTCAVREYVRKAVLAKVADQIKAAEDVAKAAKADRDDKIEKAKKLGRKLCEETQEKFVKEVKKLGLTFIPDSYSHWNNTVEKNANVVMDVHVDVDDFIETLTRHEGLMAECNPCAERDEFNRIMDEPARIKAVADETADRLLFELELGKVAKGELDSLLKDLEVAV